MHSYSVAVEVREKAGICEESIRVEISGLDHTESRQQKGEMALLLMEKIKEYEIGFAKKER